MSKLKELMESEIQLKMPVMVATFHKRKIRPVRLI